MQSDIYHLASRVRQFMEPVWPQWHEARAWPMPAVASQNTCVRTSLFLQKVFEANGYHADAFNNVPRFIEDGPDIGPYGFYTGIRWESHAWVECENFIVDITADQFGAAPVIVTRLDDPRYGKRGADTASAAFIAERLKAVELLWLEWMRLNSP